MFIQSELHAMLCMSSSQQKAISPYITVNYLLQRFELTSRFSPSVESFIAMERREVNE